jgi:hypothetical protein
MKEYTKNLVQPDRPQMTIGRMCVANWLTKATDTRPIYDSYCFSTATMVTRTRLNVTLYVHCLSCFYNIQYEWAGIAQSV